MDQLSFERLRQVNVRRCEQVFHPINGWSPAEWGVAVAGEVGEMCNLIKKLRRFEDGTNTLKDPHSAEECRKLIGKEAADAVIYLDLLCVRLGLNLGDEVRSKFNEVSERMNAPTITI